jgi:predicted metalloprotease with PDZ domain
MVERVVDEAIGVWGEPAGYDLGTYTFIIDYLPWVNGDGMEHRNSTIVTSTRTIANRAERLASLGTISHEFFHSWNMERLRDRELEPFDFYGENMSSELWLGEGFTYYYSPLINRRAGFMTDDEFAANMGGAIVGTIRSPARRHGSPMDMSRAAVFVDGTTFLDPTNVANTFLSYYTWGSVVAMGLDLTLRERFNRTLDDYMRLLWKDYGKHQSAAFAPVRPYTLPDLRNALSSLTGDAQFAKDFFLRYVEGPEVPDFGKLLDPAGFKLVIDSVETPYLGASLDDDSAGVFVNWSVEGGTAYAAGIANRDIIYSVDGIAVKSADSLQAIIARHKVGDVVQMGVEQQKVRRTIPLHLAGRRGMKIETYEKAGLSPSQDMLRFRAAWLGSRVKAGIQSSAY